jgi:chromosome segregation ATPase
MRRATPTTLHDRHQSLLTNLHELEAEVARLEREEEFLARQIREAQAQLRYYEDLLASLRREWGETPALNRIFERLH